MALAVLTPSRERPEQLREMVEAIEATAVRPVAIYIGLDEDDESPYPTTGVHYVGSRHIAHVIRGERGQLADWTNRLADFALADGHDILASFGDDHRPRTDGWDMFVCEAMHVMGSGLVYTRDGLQDKRLPTAPFWSSDIVRALEWYFFPGCKHLHADTYWLKLAQDLGRCTYLQDVLVEHMHPSAGKAEADAVNAANDAHYDADVAAYQRFLADPRGHAAALARVRSVL